MRSKGGRCSIPLLLAPFALGLCAANCAGAAQEAYERISCSEALAMGVKRFTAKYGEEKLGSDLDALFLRFAACHAAQNDGRARNVSPTVGKRVRALREMLEAWDEARLSPQVAFVGGLLEEGHYRAGVAVEREAVLEKVIRQLARTPRAGDRRAKNQARAQFRFWLTHDAFKLARPSLDELEGLDSPSRTAVQARYQSWYRRLIAVACRFNIEVEDLPPNAGAHIFRYAAVSRP